MFDSQEEITQKLGNCVVIYKDRPFYVYGGQTRTSLYGFFTEEPQRGDMEGLPVSIKDPDLNFTSVGERLGYLNVDVYGGRPYRECTFLMRMPTRRSHQGLHESNIFVEGLVGSSRLNLPATGNLRFNHGIHTENAKGFREMLQGVYPSVREVRSLMKDKGVQGRAVHRSWSIRRDKNGVGPFELFYKTDKVGYTEDIERFVLADRYRLLRKDMDVALRTG